MSSPIIYYYAGRYAMVKSGLQGPPGTIMYVMLEDAMIPKADKRKKPALVKEGEYILCVMDSENVKERKDA